MKNKRRPRGRAIPFLPDRPDLFLLSARKGMCQWINSCLTAICFVLKLCLREGSLHQPPLCKLCLHESLLWEPCLREPYYCKPRLSQLRLHEVSLLCDLEFLHGTPCRVIPGRAHSLESAHPHAVGLCLRKIRDHFGDSRGT